MKKAKTNRNIDYSAIHMQKVPESKLQEGYNPTTRQYDTKGGKRVAPGEQHSASLIVKQIFDLKLIFGL